MFENTYTVVLFVIGLIFSLGSVPLGLPVIQYLRRGQSAIGDDGVAHYFLAFSSALSLIWGLLMMQASTSPVAAAAMALPCALGFALLSAWRIPLSKNPSVRDRLGRGPQIEVFLFALLAVYFFRVWLNT